MSDERKISVRHLALLVGHVGLESRPSMSVGIVSPLQFLVFLLQILDDLEQFVLFVVRLNQAKLVRLDLCIDDLLTALRLHASYFIFHGDGFWSFLHRDERR